MLAAGADLLALEAAIVHRHVRRGRLLDVGCDTGAFFEGFPDPEWQRFGVELSASAASYAARTYKAKVFAGRVREQQLSTAFFDVVTMIDMLYYAEDPRAELSEALRVLKPGGLLVIEFAGQAWSLQRGRGLASLLIDGRWSRLHSDSRNLYWFRPGSGDPTHALGVHLLNGTSYRSSHPGAWRRGQ
jgi:SAM-dependent methyltransferase